MSGFSSPGMRRRERQRRIRTLASIAALAGLLVLSALLWPKPRHGDLSVPAATGAPQPAGVLEGRLTVTRAGERVCVTVTSVAGTAFLRFPTGWSADADLDVIDPSGSARARSGERVRLTGEPSAAAAVAPCTGTARIWSVTRLDLAR